MSDPARHSSLKETRPDRRVTNLIRRPMTALRQRWVRAGEIVLEISSRNAVCVHLQATNSRNFLKELSSTFPAASPSP